MNTDWRLTNQEKYLYGKILLYKRYTRYKKNPKWDHDHCSFCWATFMEESNPNVLHEGYCTEDEYHWICKKCFLDFKEQFNWIVKDDNHTNYSEDK
jgi:hypothetical protein